jgi:hypothetical protein
MKIARASKPSGWPVMAIGAVTGPVACAAAGAVSAIKYPAMVQTQVGIGEYRVNQVCLELRQVRDDVVSLLSLAPPVSRSQRCHGHSSIAGASPRICGMRGAPRQRIQHIADRSF